MGTEVGGPSAAGAATGGPGRGGAGKPVAILVTGMHRSGTSALARTLSLLGAALPGDLVPANEGNPEGHWEPRGMVELNDRMLADAGSDLYGMRDIAPGWFSSPAAAAFTEEAVRLVAAAFADERLVVLKDPRTALLTPIWNRALEASGFRVVHVLPLRHPADVAESLRRRHLKSIPYDAWVAPRGEAVWLRYTLAAVRGSRGHGRVFLRYGDLLSDWRREVGRVGAELGIAWPGLGTDLEAQVDAFLHANDRADGDHPAPGTDLDLGGLDLGALASACYATLASRGDDTARIDGCHAAFTARVEGSRDLVAMLEGLYPLVWRFFERSEALDGRLGLSLAAEGRLREKARQSWAALTTANGDKLRLQLDAGSRDRQVASLQAEAARRVDIAAQDHLRIAGLEEQVARLAREAVDAEPAHEAQLAALRDVAEAARRDQAEASARLAALHGSTSWRITAPLRALARLLRGRA